MIAKINESGLIIYYSEDKDNLFWDSDPFVDTVWHRWFITWRGDQGPDCYWMILE